MTARTAGSDLLDRLRQVSFPTLGHLLEEGFVHPAVRALFPGAPIVGRAATVRIDAADALAMNRALTLLRPGEVLVVDMGSDHRHAPVGAVTACAAREAGAIGVVVDGVATDLADLRRSGLRIFARGTTCLTTKPRAASDSAFAVPVVCGEVTVDQGDLVLADDNGVVFLTDEVANAVVDEALASDAAEPAVLDRLRSGEPAAAVLPPRR